MARGSVAKALAMVVIGLMLGLVGTDIHTGLQRFTFGAPDLFDGLDFVSIAVGIFGLGSIISNLEEGQDAQTTAVLKEKIQSLWPTREDFRWRGRRRSAARRSAAFSASCRAVERS